MELLTPTSRIAQRLVTRVSRFVSGQPVNLVADLGLDNPIPVEKTTLGDEEALQRLARMNALARAATGSTEDASRLARYRTHREMVDRSPEYRRCLNILVDFVFGGEMSSRAESKPFEVVYADGIDPRTREAADRITQRCGLYSMIPAVYREGRLYGDSFTELAFSQVSCVGQKPLPPWDVEVVWDEYSRLQGYRVRAAGGFRTWDGKGAKALAPIQVLHYAPDRERGNRYGSSIFHALRDAFRQFQNGVDILFVLLILQAAHRRSVSVEVPSGWTDPTIEAFVKRLKSWNSDVSFFDSNGRFHASIAAMLEMDDKVFPYRKGNAKPDFHNESQADPAPLLKVLEWMQDRIFLGVGVPKALAGLSKDTNNKATLETQGLHFVKQLRGSQKDAALLALEVIVRGLLVEEVPLKDGDVMIRMPLISEFNDRIVAETQKLRAEAAKILRSDVELPLEWVLEHVLKVPAHQVDDIMVAMAANDDDTTATDAPPVSAAEVVRANADLKEQIERLSEEVQLLKPVTASLRDIVERAAA